MSQLSSQVLVARAKERDSAAMAILFERYRDRLRLGLRRRLGYRYGRALMDSEDAVQEGILAAIHAIDRFEYRGSGSFLAWVLGVAELEVLQRLRAHRAKMRDRDAEVRMSQVGELAASGATPSQVAHGNEVEEEITACLHQLNEQEREVIVLRRYLELDTEDIRVELKLSTTGAVRALLSRAQAKLAILLDDCQSSGDSTHG